MLQWLTDNVACFRIHHNAHREFGMSVEQHLRHRARIGNLPELAHDTGVADWASTTDELWEVRATLPEGLDVEVAGPDLNRCIRGIRQRVAALRSTRESLAA